MRALLGIVLVCASGLPRAGADPATPAYRVEQRYAIEGPGMAGALAVDPRANRLYIGRSDRTEVMDVAAGRLVATITATPGVEGIALADEIGKGYASNGPTDSVTVFDLATLSKVGTVAVKGRRPDAILFDAASANLYTFNDLSRDASVIDPIRGVTLATIGLGGRPAAAVADGAGRVYVNIEDRAEVVAIDSLSSRRVATWELAECAHPAGLALDVVHHRVFTACDNSLLAVTDTDSGRRVATVPIGPGVRSACFDPQRRLIFLAEGKGDELTVVHEDDPNHYTVTARVQTRGSTGALALDSRSHRLYLVAAGRVDRPVATGAANDGDSAVLVLGN